MANVLVSVKNEIEFMMALRCGVSLIDLKDPANGALGALPLTVITSLIEYRQEGVKISATIGDIKEIDEIIKAISQLAHTNLDIIKVGIFDCTQLSALLAKLAIMPMRPQIMLVFFAEDGLFLDQFSNIRAHGIYGVMIDTRNKQGLRLSEICTVEELSVWVETAKCHHLFTGLSGRLLMSDMLHLLTCGADFMGFRSAVCEPFLTRHSLNERALGALMMQCSQQSIC